MTSSETGPAPKIAELEVCFYCSLFERRFAVYLNMLYILEKHCGQHNGEARARDVFVICICMCMVIKL